MIPNGFHSKNRYGYDGGIGWYLQKIQLVLRSKVRVPRKQITVVQSDLCNRCSQKPVIGYWRTSHTTDVSSHLAWRESGFGISVVKCRVRGLSTFPVMDVMEHYFKPQLELSKVRVGTLLFRIGSRTLRNIMQSIFMTMTSRMPVGRPIFDGLCRNYLAACMP